MRQLVSPAEHRIKRHEKNGADENRMNRRRGINEASTGALSPGRENGAKDRKCSISWILFPGRARKKANDDRSSAVRSLASDASFFVAQMDRRTMDVLCALFSHFSTREPFAFFKTGAHLESATLSSNKTAGLATARTRVHCQKCKGKRRHTEYTKISLLSLKNVLYAFRASSMLATSWPTLT